ncbi:MAG TPA: NnrU family protein [Candidatus Binataceae bacterium]|nr:NnrU family protein [Candidatus Binataceae bacterium]
MAVTNLVFAALFLPASHFGLSSSRLRDLLAAKLGERLFLALYNVISLAAFAWLIFAYRAAPLRILWEAPPALKVAILPVVLLAFVLVVAGITTPNPAIVGSARLFERPDIVRGILRVTRNSFFWGVGLWGLAHLAATGDLAGVLMFTSIATLGLIGAPILDIKKAARHGAQWKSFAAATSSLPFAAIAQGRQRFSAAEIGWWRFALAGILFLAALWAHRWAFGVSPLPAP